MSLDQEFPYIPLGRNPLAPMIMEKGCNILRGMDVRWWLSAGTALGVRRDGELIYHDTDIDVGCLDAPFDEMTDLFREQGFTCLRATPHQRAFLYVGTVFDVFTFTRHGDEVRSVVDGYELTKPARLVETLGELEFNGHTYPVPHPIDEYLEIRYGPDWRTPKTVKTYWLEDAANVR